MFLLLEVESSLLSCHLLFSAHRADTTFPATNVSCKQCSVGSVNRIIKKYFLWLLPQKSS